MSGGREGSSLVGYLALSRTRDRTLLEEMAKNGPTTTMCCRARNDTSPRNGLRSLSMIQPRILSSCREHSYGAS